MAELKPVNYGEYSHMTTFYVPKAEQPGYPSGLPFEVTLPQGTTHTQNAVYIGRERFWIGQTPVRRREQQRLGRAEAEVTLVEFNRELAGLSIPQENPPGTSWVSSAHLRLRHRNELATVRQLLPDTHGQRLVTAVAYTGEGPLTVPQPLEEISSGNAYSDRLTELGFHESDFDHMRGTGTLRDATDVPALFKFLGDLVVQTTAPRGRADGVLDSTVRAGRRF